MNYSTFLCHVTDIFFDGRRGIQILKYPHEFRTELLPSCCHNFLSTKNLGNNCSCTKMVVTNKSGVKSNTTKRNQTAADNHDRAVDSWQSFFADARKISRRKKRKLAAERNKKKREKEEAKEREILRWLELYEKRLESDENWDEYCMTPVPEGAWGRVD